MNFKIETGVQLFSRVKAKSHLEKINTKLFPDESMQQNSVVEITGNNIEKYKLLTDFVIRCILPPTYNDEWKDTGVIFINTDHQISIMTFVKAIDSHLKNVKVKPSSVILEKALKNLTIVNCFNCDDFETTIYNLERIVNSNENNQLLVFDNIAPYYWIKRFKSNMLSLYSHSLQNFDNIYSIIKDLNLMFVFIRNEAQSYKKRFSVKVDYKIDVGESGDNCNACVNDYVNQKEYTVTYKSDLENSHLKINV